MRKIILLSILFLSIFYSFGQAIEKNFIDNFKTSKWKSLVNFNDSTLLQLNEIKLVRWNPALDSLRHQPTVWIFNEEFKIKYYHPTILSEDSIAIQTKSHFNTMDCQYAYDNKKGLLTLILDNKEKTSITFKTAIVSSGSFILLTRIK